MNKEVSLARRSFLMASCLCVGSTIASPLYASIGKPEGTPSGIYRLTVGDCEVTVLSDGDNPLAARNLLQGDSERILDSLRSHSLGETVETSHNSFVIRTKHRLVLIDAGAGTLLGPKTGKLLSNLSTAGYLPEQVDEVYLTHMHADHIGGLMSGDQRSFPNAIVRADRRDVEYWLSAENMRAAPASKKRFFQAAVSSLSAYIQAGRLSTFEGGTELAAGIRARPAYGHTPGHTMYELESKGVKLLLWGDIVHVAAVQFSNPSVTIQYDTDPTAAEHEHWRVFAEAARSTILVGGAHLPFPGIGYVGDNGDKTYTFVPLSRG